MSININNLIIFSLGIAFFMAAIQVLFNLTPYSIPIYLGLIELSFSLFLIYRSFKEGGLKSR